MITSASQHNVYNLHSSDRTDVAHYLHRSTGHRSTIMAVIGAAAAEAVAEAAAFPVRRRLVMAAEPPSPPV